MTQILVKPPYETLACDHALSLYLCNLLSGGGRYFFPSRAKEAKKQKMITIIIITPDLRLHHVTKFSIHLSFTVHYNYTKIGRFTPILSRRIVSSCFYLLLSHFEYFSTADVYHQIERGSEVYDYRMQITKTNDNDLLSQQKAW